MRLVVTLRICEVAASNLRPDDLRIYFISFILCRQILGRHMNVVHGRLFLHLSQRNTIIYLSDDDMNQRIPDKWL